MESKIFFLLHLAKKAGKLKFGMAEVERSCSYKRARLVLIAKNLSNNSRKKVEKIKEISKISFLEYSTKEKFSFEFQKRDLGILILEDINFAKGISDLLKSGTED